MADKQLIFSLTKKDFRWGYYKGSGKGGQKRNKTENCCRCTHEPSGAVGKSEEGRSKEQNKRRAFKRMTESTEFRRWIRIETAKRTGELVAINRKIEKSLANLEETKIEAYINGKWEALPCQIPV